MADQAPTAFRPPALRGLVKLMRPLQWVKNGFVLAPLLFAGQFLNRQALLRAAVAFALFCLASSATYVLNDYRDIEKDRQHPKKSKTRPLAAGIVSRPQALALMAVLYGATAAGFLVQPRTMLVIAAYLALNVAYSFALKHQPVVDIFTIAIGFVLRVYAGAVALSVPLSGWMFITTLSLALYLGSVKRRQELVSSGSEGRKVLEQYSVSLVDRYAEMAATCTLVFYSLFVMSTRPAMIATVPFVIFGLFRYWFIVECLDGGESPSDSLLSDWQLIATLLAWAGMCLYALWPH